MYAPHSQSNTSHPKSYPSLECNPPPPKKKIIPMHNSHYEPDCYRYAVISSLFLRTRKFHQHPSSTSFSCPGYIQAHRYTEQLECNNLFPFEQTTFVTIRYDKIAGAVATKASVTR